MNSEDDKAHIPKGGFSLPGFSSSRVFLSALFTSLTSARWLHNELSQIILLTILSGFLGWILIWTGWINEALKWVGLPGYGQENLTYLEYQYVDPALDKNLVYKPKTYRLLISNKQNLNLLEEPEPSSGLHSQLILNLPEGWIINLFNLSAKKHQFDNNAYESITRIFPKIKDDIIRQLYFGGEIEFFESKGATYSPSDAGGTYSLNSSANKLKLQVRIDQNKRFVDPKSCIPESLEVITPTRSYKVLYKSYQTHHKFNPDLFKPAPYIQVTDGKPKLSFTERDTPEERKQAEELVVQQRYQWTHYYEHPVPDRLNDLFFAVENFGGRLGISSLPHFLAPIFEQGGTNLSNLTDGGISLSQDVKLQIYRGLQICNKEVCKQKLLANPYQFRTDLVRVFAGVNWIPITKREAFTLEALGQYWSYFYATGDENILAAINQVGDGGGGNTQGARGPFIDPSVRKAFKESLLSHAKEHEKVARFLKRSGKRG